MVHTAVADIIRPSVTAEDPEGFFGEQIGHMPELVEFGQFGITQRGQNIFAVLAGLVRIVHVVQPVLEGCGKLFGQAGHLQRFAHLVGQTFTALMIGVVHAKTVFGGVFKQRVGPGRTKTVLIGAVGVDRGRTSPDGAATRGIGYDHTFAEELGEQLHVRGFAAAGTGA